jgi:hypothetical protein
MSYTVPDSAYGGRPSAIAAAAGALVTEAVVVLGAGGVAISTYDTNAIEVTPYSFYGRADSPVAIGTIAAVALLFAGALAVVGQRVWSGSGPARTAAAILHGLVLVVAIRIGSAPLAGSLQAWQDVVYLGLAAIAVVVAVAGTALLAQPAAATFRRASGPLA